MDFVISFVVSGTFYYAYRYSMQKIDAVLSAKSLESAQPGDYVKIEGKVTLFNNNKLDSLFAFGKVSSVMHEITRNHLVSKWDGLLLRWVFEIKTISRTFRSVPFQLTTSLFPNTPLVNINEIRPEDIANEPPLLTLASNFSPTSPSNFIDTTPSSSNIKSHGLQIIERALPVGTSVTVVGELFESAGDDLTEGILELVKPKNTNLPYILTRETYRSFVHRQTAVARLLWWMFLGSISVCGICILRRVLSSVYPRYKVWCEHRRLQRYLTQRKLRKQRYSKLNDAGLDANVCAICFRTESDITIYTCEHFYACFDCANKLSDCSQCKGTS